MTEEEKRILIKRMLENLKILRIKLGISQDALGERVGVSRFTIAAYENQKRDMSWNSFLALLMIFTNNKETSELLGVFNIYTDELQEMLKK